MDTSENARTRIKICCMSSAEEVRIAVAAGADALGFVSAMPSGAGIIDEELIARLTPLAPPPVATFLLSCATDAEALIAQHARCKTNTFQLCDSAIRETIRIPLFLAGGLNADNVREAISTVRPFGVDVCSGVRTDGRLDAAKVNAFAAAVRE